ncbi:class II fructose-bisphosphate aldolase [Streptomyces europaeiscabiei]|uniref:Class II fructose-bisphosphate aldolase n=1 Tax=Streptomyces europaeiscabiei TaxID=146819 RepID=A0ABU4NU58_9ACTN|nr:class II fructose-bisphosphate aldolase [Streptomyces europaeiscabiei]MDX2527299.1 class II fructose-bisphosphate aldolase [Streptomyces europaeiscabiei]MDX2759204.1 class II fructose-bisphosphate aldolase [Streptomyces europaeiscabiei]MDX2766899.1 class II fructose-bisphosphate aldolase [Streptomyces europaeiscabiei]MDX3549062.1 class II fructose-bisphosphate aldolase [Streptomyces europaeiscabiei]MDX3558280.1 class II fructose-bisphosphate aldolase [Streptomyces europaeiscabiei]
MPLISTAELVRSARADGRGVGAFNVITLEHAEAIVMGAEAAGVPVICQISENAVRFHGGSLGPLASATAAVAEGARVPVGLHLDHVTDEELLRRASDFGFGSAMYDASALPHAENVAATRAAADWAHAQGLWLEAELGEIGGKDGVHAPGVRTDPEEARAFVAATGVDALAVAVGSSHAMTTRTAKLDHELIARLAHAVPAPLVLHGSTGVPDDELRRAAKGGMTKINVGTALNIAFTRAIRAFVAEDGHTVDPRAYLATARTRMAEAVEHLLRVLA